MNLLENAIRYTPLGSPHRDFRRALWRSCGDSRRGHGPGLPAGRESQIFDKFFRGKQCVADGQRGVGLGLAICRALSERTAAKSRAANRPEGGAEFLISLPCAALESRSYAGRTHFLGGLIGDVISNHPYAACAPHRR